MVGRRWFCRVVAPPMCHPGARHRDQGQPIAVIDHYSEHRDVTEGCCAAMPRRVAVTLDLAALRTHPVAGLGCSPVRRGRRRLRLTRRAVTNAMHVTEIDRKVHLIEGDRKSNGLQHQFIV